MKFITISLLSFIAAISLSASCNQHASTECVAKPIEDCICTKEYRPVCGCDGKTYGNACEARCNSIESFTEGECD